MKPNLRETIMLRTNKYEITIFRNGRLIQGITQNIIHWWFYDESLVLNDVGSIRYAYPYYIILIQGQYALNLDNIQNFLSHSGLKTFFCLSLRYWKCSVNIPVQVIILRKIKCMQIYKDIFIVY